MVDRSAVSPLGTSSGPLFAEPDLDSTGRPIYAFALNFERDDF